MSPALVRNLFKKRKKFNTKCLHKVIVPLTHDGARGWIFDLVCPGYAMSVSYKRLLLLKNATVNWNSGFHDVCKEKQVIVAYNHEPDVFEVNSITGQMVQYPLNTQMRYKSMAEN